MSAACQQPPCPGRVGVANLAGGRGARLDELETQRSEGRSHSRGHRRQIGRQAGLSISLRRREEQLELASRADQRRNARGHRGVAAQAATEQRAPRESDGHTGRQLVQLHRRVLGGAKEEHRVRQATAAGRAECAPGRLGHRRRISIETEDERGRLHDRGRQDRATVTGADVDRHSLVASNDLGELTDVHLEEATPDDLLQHAGRITRSVNSASFGCSAFTGRSVSRGVTVVSDAPAVDDLTARRILEGVHARNGQQLFGFARRLGLTDDEADDVTQEALLRLWRALRGTAVIDDPAAWAFRATYRLAMDRHRLARRWQALAGVLRGAESEAAGLAEPPAGADELIAVWTEVDRLPVRQRQVLYLHYRADLTFEAIGTVLAIEPSSARGHASRGVARLRERLAGGG